LRILVVSQYFWPEEFRVNDLVRGLTDRGHKVTVLTGIPNYPGGRFFSGYGIRRNGRQTYEGAHVLRVPLIPRGKGHGIRLALNYASFAISSMVLGPLICRGEFDLIFVCQLSPVTIALPGILFRKIKKAPMILWILDLWPESLSISGVVRSNFILKPLKRMVGYIYRRSDLILVASKGFMPSVADQGVAKNRIRYFPNWHEPEYTTLETETNTEGTDLLPAGFTVVFAGNIGAAQSFETILEAAEMLKDEPEIKWIIIGDGRRLNWVKEEAIKRDLGRSFHILGRRPVGEMRSLFIQAGAMLVTLQPNPAMALTVPGKIQSYMACAKPIIAALDGEGRRIIEESGAGLACPAGDAKGLASIVSKMFHMPAAERTRMGLKGREYCEQHFNRSMLMSRLEDWINDVASAKVLLRPRNSGRI
jgi:colanic acid biosynthesis glycosyl transferase WcaI